MATRKNSGLSEGASRGQARVADRHPELGFPGALRGRAGVEFPRQIYRGRARPASLLLRLQPSVGLGAAPEDRRHRRGARLLRRPRPDDKALGQQRARAHDPLRADPDGKPYPPFHDVQCMVDGEAAACLTEVAESRWRAAGCTVRNRRPSRRTLAGLGAGAGPRNDGGIARTGIATASEPSVHEVARLFEASINAADRFIYIENQFTSAVDIAQPAGAADAGRAAVTGFDRHAKTAFVLVRIAGDAERPRRLHRPVRRGRCRGPGSLPLSVDAGAGGAAAVMVHSKVMIVDDRSCASARPTSTTARWAPTPNVISPSRRRRRRNGNISPGFAAR